MRIGIYNRYWATRGGAERYAGVVAETLARDHEVDLIGVEDVALDRVAEHLGLDFSDVAFRRWPAGDERHLSPLTAEYDLLINSTYLSRLPSRARASVYLVLFPQKVPSPRLTRLVHRTADWLDSRQSRAVIPVEGFYAVDWTGSRWSAERALLRIAPGALEELPLRLHFAPLTPWPLDEALVEVKAPGLSWHVELDDLVLDGPALHSPDPIDIELHCRPFRPAEHDVSADDRPLGVYLRPELRSRPRFALAWLSERLRGLIDSQSPDYLNSYQLLLAISEYTSTWITKRWGRSNEVLAPPLDSSLFTAPDASCKEKVILSVGRFFSGSHNKKHLEMLRVFRRMCDRGDIPDGWEYRLVGNLHRNRLIDLEYFAELEQLAVGYPVKLLVDLPLPALREEYRRASIFWHAAGWGESERRRPEKFEHFGLTTCEAMSSGCIPVVIAKAGQLEIVTHGDSGFLFSTGGELTAYTRKLVRDHGKPWTDALRRRAASEIKRFDRERFANRLVELLDSYDMLAPTSVVGAPRLSV